MSQNSWNAEFNNAKGSLLVGNNIRPIVRTVGTDGQVLMADSAQADGVAWSNMANIQLSEIVLTSLQVKNLVATPIIVIPAQGANTVVIILHTIGRLNYGGTSAFTLTSNIDLVYGNPFVVPAAVGAIGGADLASTFDSTATEPAIAYSNALNSEIYNTDIYASNVNGIEMTGNAADDNTVSIKCLYYVFTIP